MCDSETRALKRKTPFVDVYNEASATAHFRETPCLRDIRLVCGGLKDNEMKKKQPGESGSPFKADASHMTDGEDS